MRTSILYYNCRIVGEPIMWLALSMGVMENARDLVSNKKLIRAVWRDLDPSGFTEMEERFLPRTWSDTETFEREMEARSLYVFKTVLGSMGEGILFKDGVEMAGMLSEKEGRGDRSGWIVQEFVDPLLFDGRKTHMRAITLIIVQPDGAREFYIYDKMRIFTAPERFDRARLLGSGGGCDSRCKQFMLLTNLHQCKIHFEMDPMNEGKVFSSAGCIYDAETHMGGGKFRDLFDETGSMHSLLYSIIGDSIECGATEVSIYDDACFHIMASDVAVDSAGNPYFLEMNNAMGYLAWKTDEIAELSNGVASLVRGTASPYVVEDSSMWEKLGV